VNGPFEVIQHSLGWMIIDTRIEDGEDCLVGGSTDKATAEAECNEMNLIFWQRIYGQDL
jgi:hypothetical protein